jgi:hypothetical protein
VFENIVLRRTIGSKRGEVTGGLRRLHNDEFYKLCSSPSIFRITNSRRMEWGDFAAQMGKGRRNAYSLLAENAEGNKILGDNIKLALGKKERSSKEWINLADDKDK